MTDSSPNTTKPEQGWFKIYQDGMEVAGGSGPYEFVKREAAHYAMMYGQDGPVKVVVRRMPKRRHPEPRDS